jgi:methylated-DNA-[protein]-cysteine S-methyltransferase
MESAVIKTPIGFAQIIGDTYGISGIKVVEGAAVSESMPPILKICADQLSEYFEGRRTDFTFPTNATGTPFQQKVWKALTEIDYGTTTTYLQLAKKLGDEKAIRAVAAANGRNPLWIVVPCHRVIGSDGSLTGYAGGIWRKKWLLEHERPPIQQRLKL